MDPERDQKRIFSNYTVDEVKQLFADFNPVPGADADLKARPHRIDGVRTILEGSQAVHSAFNPEQLTCIKAYVTEFQKQVIGNPSEGIPSLIDFFQQEIAQLSDHTEENYRVTAANSLHSVYNRTNESDARFPIIFNALLKVDESGYEVLFMLLGDFAADITTYQQFTNLLVTQFYDAEGNLVESRCPMQPAIVTIGKNIYSSKTDSAE